MKKRILLTAAAAGLIAMGGAQAHAKMDGDKMFSALDSDGNGALSSEELSRMHDVMAKQRFESADTNGDGNIDRDEFMAQSEKRAARMFEHMDKDENGTLDADEATPKRHGKHGSDAEKHHDSSQQAHKGDKAEHGKRKGPAGMLERMDEDGDGSVSKAEWDNAMQHMHERHDKMKDAE